MKISISQGFALIAVVLFLWVAAISITWVAVGNAGFLFCMGLASLAAHAFFR